MRITVFSVVEPDGRLSYTDLIIMFIQSSLRSLENYLVTVLSSLASGMIV